MVWSKSRCSVCKRPGHNRASCPERRPAALVKAAPITKDDAARAFLAFYRVGDEMTGLRPDLRIIVLRALCAFYLEEESEPSSGPSTGEKK